MLQQNVTLHQIDDLLSTFYLPGFFFQPSDQRFRFLQDVLLVISRIRRRDFTNFLDFGTRFGLLHFNFFVFHKFNVQLASQMRQ